MFIRRAFTTFLGVESETLVPVSAPNDRTIATSTVADWIIDWRWFSEPSSEGAQLNGILPNDALPREGSLINWPSWARLTTPRHG
jgi:hypothetical protein